MTLRHLAFVRLVEADVSQGEIADLGSPEDARAECHQAEA